VGSQHRATTSLHPTSTLQSSQTWLATPKNLTEIFERALQ